MTSSSKTKIEPHTWLSLAFLIVGIIGLVIFSSLYHLNSDNGNESYRTTPQTIVEDASSRFDQLDENHHGVHETPTPNQLTPLQEEQLKKELSATEANTPGPLVKDAKSAGYLPSNDFEPANNIHLTDWNLMKDGNHFDPAAPSQLLVSSQNDDGRVLAAVYTIAGLGDVPPAGFTGDADVWHRHVDDACDMGPGVIAPQDRTKCVEAGGKWTHFDVWMIHVWVVPGVGNPDGVFANDNPCVDALTSCPSSSPIR